ncbi:MAG: type II toxin-antitoxin system prevent-host-death family antitoxin [Propionibacteriaceae bacterium]|nr:type II toxin-antitoxin system prevent-host-death family antitoxin [Propionibacteriaceae bacterium]
MSQVVTIREVNQHTSAVFKRVSAGEELIVTRDGRPQARILPYQPRDEYEQLVAAGSIVPAQTHSYRPTYAMEWSNTVAVALDAERAERDWL